MYGGRKGVGRLFFNRRGGFYIVRPKYYVSPSSGMPVPVMGALTSDNDLHIKKKGNEKKQVVDDPEFYKRKPMDGEGIGGADFKGKKETKGSGLQKVEKKKGFGFFL